MNEFCKDKSHVNHFWEWKKETNDPLIPGINHYYKLIQLQEMQRTFCLDASLPFCQSTEVLESQIDATVTFRCTSYMFNQFQ